MKINFTTEKDTNFLDFQIQTGLIAPGWTADNLQNM